MSTTPTPFVKSAVSKYYFRLVENGTLERDPAQLRVIQALDNLNADLAERRLANKKSSLGWLFSKRKSAWTDVSGLYIWGSVGRGKTMLMDAFFNHSPIRRKRRIHFHEFMADVHERIHAHRKLVKQGIAKEDDPIGPVSDQIADEVRLLCFDEFTVRDVADAAIMRRLFSKLFEHNVVVVATSNVAPDNLYKDGLRRGDFLPFIDLLKERVGIVELDARTDFRLEKLGNRPVYSHPLDQKAASTYESAWEALIGNAPVTPATLEVKGREVHVPQAALGIARFHFSDLCERPLGANDYLKIAKKFHTVFIEGIPTFDAAKRNEAKRFINLIDAIYDSQTKMVVTAEAPAPDLNAGLGGTEAFEFDRTVSRLIEMQSDDYLALPHGTHRKLA